MNRRGTGVGRDARMAEMSANKDVANIIMDANEKKNRYKEVVEMSYCVLVILSIVFFVFGIAFILTISYDYFEIALIAYISVHTFVYFAGVFTPIVLYYLDLDTIQNPSDRHAFRAYTRTDFFRTSRDFFYTPGCLYDNRDVENVRFVNKLNCVVFFVSVAILWIGVIAVRLIRDYREDPTFDDISPGDLLDIANMYGDGDTEETTVKLAEKHMLSIVLPQVWTLIMLASLEIFFVRVYINAFRNLAVQLTDEYF
jgi:uncharacterized membrane protein (DUF485 family)